MNDRELLELAAKAAGINVFSVIDDPIFGFGVNTGEIDVDLWNPIADDGDALRLAVGLMLCFGPNIDGDLAVCFGSDGRNITEPFGADPCAATRRAITRAAAEIGSKM